MRVGVANAQQRPNTRRGVHSKQQALTLIQQLITPPHSLPSPSSRHNHDQVFGYCHLSWPLNFVFLNNAVGFGGCGTVRWHEQRSPYIVTW
jgi:hypothetical protein